MSHSPLHIFSIPQDILDSLSHRNLLSQVEPVKTHEGYIGVESESSTQPGLGSLSCNICLGATFDDVEDQRSHFRSDWHRYNVKSRLASGKVVSEADFGVLVEGLEDSLSGSESSSGNEDSSDTDAIQTLLSKSRVKSRSPSPTGTPNIPLSAVTWFHSPPSTQLGIYRTIFPLGTPVEFYLSELRAMQAPVPEGRKWAMFMVAGGHFAGLVARVSRPSSIDSLPQNGKQKKPVPEIEILKHKTFHRYTTRRKQGGSQSLNDNAKGNAKSAGALLRRYGEQALRDDIRNLIEEWEDDISSCERIFMRASGANRRIFLDYDKAIISKGDDRLRSFPFPTRRPTQAELSRCLLELTRVKITHFTEEELKAQDDAFLASLPKPKKLQIAPVTDIKQPDKKPLLPELSKEEELIRDKWIRLCDMIKKGRLEAAKAFWEREGEALGGVNARIPESAGEKMCTLLQLAASSGQTETTSWLLDDLNADPTIPVPIRTHKEHLSDVNETTETSETPSSIRPTKVAYDVASSREVRDIFRRSAAMRPDAWDWLGLCHVPSILSADMEADRDSRKKERRKGLRDKIKEREAKEREREQGQEQAVETVKVSPPLPPTSKVSGPQKLGGAPTASQGLAGLTPEMRARIERERRARAAEARFKSTK